MTDQQTKQMVLDKLRSTAEGRFRADLRVNHPHWMRDVDMGRAVLTFSRSEHGILLACFDTANSCFEIGMRP